MNRKQFYCAVDGCGAKHLAKGFCKIHYSRFKRHGSTDKPKRPDITGQKNPHWRGGKTVAVDGRVLVYSPLHPHPNWKNYVYRYRLVMEKHLGRILLPSELVHHKNGDPTDDRLENLELSDAANHARLHMLEKMGGRWALEHAACIQCGTTQQKHKARGFCEPCYEKQRERRAA